MKILTPKKSNSAQNQPGKIKSAQRKSKRAKKAKLVTQTRKSKRNSHLSSQNQSTSQEETLLLEDIDSESHSQFTPTKLETPGKPFSQFDDSFNLKTHKSSIFKTPEKDDYILAGSQNVSPTAQFLDMTEAGKNKEGDDQDFLKRTKEVFRQEKLKNQEGGKILIRLDFGKRDLISSLFGYP